MKRNLIFISMIIGISSYIFAQPKLGKDPIGKVIAAMTIEEKVELIVGSAGAAGNESATIGKSAKLVDGAAGSTNPIPRLGIPATVLADGPAGLRIDAKRSGSTKTYYCTHFPVETLLSSSWNTTLVESVGKAMGDEAKEYGVDVLLAPATNIHRNPLNGRNFEYYSEDPYLSGKICAAMIRGVQSNGVGTSLKHFAFNNQESNRTGNNVIISPRTAREIYLKPFEIAVKESQPWTIMSSYNRVNGTYTSERADLLTTILRDEWGFEGLVMTDWYGGRCPEWQMTAGNDLLMPGTVKQKEKILSAVKKGTLSLHVIDENVKRILEMILRSLRFSGYKYSDNPDLTAHADVARSAATEGMVLLKNDNNTLPLTSGVKNMAVFGRTSYDFMAGGTGSGDVNHAYIVSLTQELTNAGFKVEKSLQKKYSQYLLAENPKLAKNEWWYPRELIPEMPIDKASIAKLAKSQNIALITIGKTSGEFLDRNVDDDYSLTDRETALINDVCEAFHAEGKKVVVVLNVCGVIETESWKSKPDAILLAWMAGQEGGNSVADILKGNVAPSGKLPMTFPVKYSDVNSAANFPDSRNITDEMIKKSINLSEMSNTDSNVKNFDYTEYTDGIMVGYRYYDTKNIKVSYPFGYGLSYTTFNYSGLSIEKQGNDYLTYVTVTNSGKIAAKDVVQLYVAAPGLSMEKPAKELKAFAKTKLLKPRESQTIKMVVTLESMASFDETLSAWVVEPGTYNFKIGSSASHIVASSPINVSSQIITEYVHNVLSR